ncbi:hypothetical protein [Flexivirga alba]|uniref:Secreted protein n=1 Tax=Flexivirga alba TaxID=702742 RepID=A0ABW2AIW0_9MICO
MDWGSALVALGGVALGGVLGVVTTWLAGRQARSQAERDRVADLARVEAVAFLTACDEVWRGHSQLGRAVGELMARDSDPRPGPELDRQEAFRIIREGKIGARRAADALAVLLDDDAQSHADRLLTAVDVTMEWGLPTGPQQTAYDDARASFIVFMRLTAAGTL